MESWQALLLGMVEGLTEYLPVSSTGHLLFLQRLFGIDKSVAADSWAIAIQFGAILAVLVVYSERIKQMFYGISGRDRDGRRLLINVLCAFAPAAVVGVAFDDLIEKHLFNLNIVAISWIVWGIVILIVFFKRRHMDSTDGRPIETLTWRQSIIIGLFQCLAMIPGTSRSLVCILGALAVGLSLPSAVELSFLLGVVTLGSATAYSLVFNSSVMTGAFGVQPLIIGLLTSFAFGVLSVKWMVSYLTRHGMTIFGWYRIAIAILALALVRLGIVAA